MVRRKSTKAIELDIQLAEAVKGVKSGLYKSLYKAVKVLRLSRASIARHVSGGLSRTQARHTQQKLSYKQENILLKWIKHLTISGYSPGH